MKNISKMRNHLALRENSEYGKHTQNLLVGKAHDVHGFHGLLEIVFVLLPWDWDVTVGQEAVVVESFQEQVGCEGKMEKLLEVQTDGGLFGKETQITL